MNRRAFLGLAVAGVLVPVVAEAKKPEAKYLYMSVPGKIGVIGERIRYEGFDCIVDSQLHNVVFEGWRTGLEIL